MYCLIARPPHTCALTRGLLSPYLFMGPLALAGRLRTFMHTPHQYALAKYVSECLSHEPALGS